MIRRSDVARAPVLIPLTRFTCASCPYRASSRIAPERCPMCGGTAWHYESDHRVSRLGSLV
jgi:rubrerythrin